MENAKELRAKMKAKAHRLADEKPGKVDASDWTPSEPLNTEAKTGLRPISRRAYKSGGSVEGEECAPRADKRPRTGNKPATPDSLMNRDLKSANEDRPGKKHIGGMKKGGMAKQEGGAVEGKLPERTGLERLKDKVGLGQKAGPSSGDSGQRYSAEDRAAMDKAAKAASGMKKGGRTKKLGGGALGAGIMGGVGPALLGGMLDKDKKETMKKGGRAERASGGRTKGTTNINIVIGQPKKPDEAMNMDAMGKPPKMDAGLPPPMPAPPAGAPMGLPPGLPPMAPGGGPNMPPPSLMGRKSGGRVSESYRSLKGGAGSGLGRLQKAEAAARGS